MRMGYKIYSYDDLPREVKDGLSGHPDVCGEKSGEWVFMEVSITRPLPHGKVPQSKQSHPHTSNRDK